MKKSNTAKRTVVWGLIIGATLALYWLIYLISPGNFHSTETYKLNISKSCLIKQLEYIRRDKNLTMPDSSIFSDGPSQGAPAYYRFYYYKDNLIYNLYIYGDEASSSLGFIGVMDIHNGYYLMKINEDKRINSKELKHGLSEDILANIDDNEC